MKTFSEMTAQEERQLIEAMEKRANELPVRGNSEDFLIEVYYEVCNENGFEPDDSNPEFWETLANIVEFY